MAQWLGIMDAYLDFLNDYPKLNRNAGAVSKTAGENKDIRNMQILELSKIKNTWARKSRKGAQKQTMRS